MCNVSLHDKIAEKEYSHYHITRLKLADFSLKNTCFSIFCCSKQYERHFQKSTINKILLKKRFNEKNITEIEKHRSSYCNKNLLKFQIFFSNYIFVGKKIFMLKVP